MGRLVRIELTKWDKTEYTGFFETCKEKNEKSLKDFWEVWYVGVLALTIFSYCLYNRG